MNQWTNSHELDLQPATEPIAPRPRRRGLWGSVTILVLASLSAAASVAGCSPDHPLPAGLLENSEKPACGELTYQNFGAEFFHNYCLRCHNSELTTDLARTDAPTGINYNTLDGIRLFQLRIRLRAGVQGDMPPSILPVPRPSEEERLKLIDWIDCGTPSDADVN